MIANSNQSKGQNADPGERASAGQGSPMGQVEQSEKYYRSIGVLFVSGAPRDLQEYMDLRKIVWDPLQLRYDLKYGVLPSGLVLREAERVMVVLEKRIHALDAAMRVVK